MPIEIRELVIKVNIVEDHKATDTVDSHNLSDLKRQIIKECTERVMAKLEKKSER
ncbi:DUF5908 family protein [Flavobacterium chilense]|uniref:Uncharacterized protein n=1 Tax=Flavobacterium chilense TaxID=946677 RepID=A0A1M7FIZ0_9FLAO|nr:MULTISPECIES: DUF5908 family protein [Flavobacterium]SHM03950.1 hypothetical protein SAMN05444484_103393 [Flavobacterium chilense]